MWLITGLLAWQSTQACANSTCMGFFCCLTKCVVNFATLQLSRLCANFTWTLNIIYSTDGLLYWWFQCYDVGVMGGYWMYTLLACQLSSITLGTINPQLTLKYNHSGDHQFKDNIEVPSCGTSVKQLPSDSCMPLFCICDCSEVFVAGCSREPNLISYMWLLVTFL